MPVEAWIHEIDPEQLLDALPGPLREAMDGWDSLRIAEFLVHHCGQNIYVPGLDHVTRDLKRRFVLEAFSGANHRELARRYGVSLAHVYRILSEGRMPRQDIEQEELFS